MKYSFLICAYNAEKYLEKCLESIMNQEFEKVYKVVIINDGSADNTEKIARSFKGVKIISQLNGGLPGARNSALKNSVGNWILFVDTDDYVSSNYLKEIDNAILSDGSLNFIKIKEKKDSKADKNDKKIQSNKMDDSVVSRAINRVVFKDYKFPNEYRFAVEDWDFYVHNLHKLVTKDISDHDNLYYFYNYTFGSLSKTNKIYRSMFDHALSIIWRW
ncbi:glycosyltransferase family 2 protein [Candidatus Mycoplasma mahonii]|uniref:glycosyltransferase family 2 protein n=1 Tax=Candidatus Mycoplasma mahonii TaxID=3004105 RepID=UPI0026EFC76B|nr:glycosyltransferase family A protein [Candidatus Mycoplasma mahonii]WKX02595.1 glycosyltransferase family A protein [Candidatus Mycoplasma mahonii]